MALLVIEKDICTKGPKEGSLLLATQKQRLINTNIPGSQSPDDAFMRGRRTGGHQGGTNRRLINPQQCLNVMQRSQESLEGTAGERISCLGCFVFGKGLQPLFAVKSVVLIGEQDRISIKGNPQLTGVGGRLVGCEDGCRRMPGRQRLSHIFGI